MLQHLSITNYALIRELEIDFEKGFSVMTGETGSGKSIILGALGLIMGQRADSRVISDGEQKCVIEADFHLTGGDLENFFQENDLDYEDGICSIRRELNRNGKSRTFVNDTPVALTTLKELTDQLIDIHSQHENLLLKSNLFQLETIDTIAVNQLEKVAYVEAYERYVTTKRMLEEHTENAKKSKEEEDYIRYQFNQLEEANLREGEGDELEQELEVLKHAEVIKTNLLQTFYALDGEQGVVEMLHGAQGSLHKVAGYMQQVEELAQRLDSALIELKDVASEVEDLAEKMEVEPERMQQVEDRLDLLHTLMQKHACQTDGELLRLKQDFALRLEIIDHSEEKIRELTAQLEMAEKEMKAAGEKLTASRKRIKTPTEERLTTQLKSLGVPHPNFQIEYAESQNPTKNGMDEINFLFAANKNQSLRNVADVASGGEVARLMLCLKSLLAEHRSLPTLIFDEIDTGVSGEVATQMAVIMRNMAQYMQVMAITHLPQIAAKGNVHYKVYKQDADEHTETQIKRLTQEERVVEIAQVLSGANVSEAALQNARELLQE
ncbi:MAG: DNA repair protein RecN [Paludibacteraceae bacterium]|nr:DNA repair protein RecN [Paludibacteraceae bacterium]